MGTEPNFEIDLPIPWLWSSSESLLTELYREIPPGHQLKGIRMKTIAKRQDCDDVLFEIIGDRNQYAIVHLTWNVETSPQVPYTHLYQTWEDVWSVIQADALEFD